MSPYLIALVGLIYAYVSFENFRSGNHGVGIAFAGYAFSNVGFIFLTGGSAES